MSDGLDSLDWIELIMMVEEELCFSIPERKAERMTTFGHMRDYIDRQSGYRPCDDFTTRAGATSAFL